MLQAMTPGLAVMHRCEQLGLGNRVTRGTVQIRPRQSKDNSPFFRLGRNVPRVRGHGTGGGCIGGRGLKGKKQG